MRSALILVGALYILFFCVSSAAFSQEASPQAAPQQPAAPLVPPVLQSAKIRVQVDRVDVGVTVTDAQGHFVTGLQRQDFHVFDDGLEQPLTDFAPIDEPGQVLILVEAGPAVYFLERGHLRAVYTLLQGLSSGDRVALARYAEAPQLLLNFTPDKQLAAGALDQLSFNLGFGSLNLSSSLSSVLDWLALVDGKKTIVLLSTGVDTSPESIALSLLARLKTSDIRILAVSLGAELRSPPPSRQKRSKKDRLQQQQAGAASEGFAAADQELHAIAEASGGRAYFPRSANDFAAVYSQIAALVRHEYTLAFAPPVHDGKLHTIGIRLSPAAGSSSSSPADFTALRVDHRHAYLAPGPPSS